MKKRLFMAVILAPAILSYGAQKAPIEPEKTLIHSKIIEYRNRGKLLQAKFYFMKEPQPGKAATSSDIVAYIWLTPIGNRNFYLEYLQVDPYYRERLGYGDFLFKLMKDYLRNYGAERLSWTAVPFGLKPGESYKEMLPKLIKFYERQGGKVIGTPGEISASMELDLKPLGKLRQSWLPESQDTLSKGDSRENIDTITIPNRSAIKEADAKALASPASFVIINSEESYNVSAPARVKFRIVENRSDGKVINITFIPIEGERLRNDRKIVFNRIGEQLLQLTTPIWYESTFIQAFQDYRYDNGIIGLAGLPLDSQFYIYFASPSWATRRTIQLGSRSVEVLYLRQSDRNNRDNATRMDKITELQRAAGTYIISYQKSSEQADNKMMQDRIQSTNRNYIIFNAETPSMLQRAKNYIMPRSKL